MSSCTGGLGNCSGGGGVNEIEVRITTWRCDGCGETYRERCRCNGNVQKCPRCGMDVFFTNGVLNEHFCRPLPVPNPSPTPAILHAQILRQAHDGYAAHFYRLGRQHERDGVETPAWVEGQA